MYTPCRPTYQFRYNVGPASQPLAGDVAGYSQTGIPSTQPIAGLMPTNRQRHWPNTTPTLGLLYT